MNNILYTALCASLGRVSPVDSIKDPTERFPEDGQEDTDDHSEEIREYGLKEFYWLFVEAVGQTDNEVLNRMKLAVECDDFYDLGRIVASQFNSHAKSVWENKQ